jgi:hypothetical protein
MKTRAAHVPAMSEASVNHTQIAQYISDEYGIPGWWCQAVTVEYELARGLRERHQKSDGYSVGISKTVATSLAKLYEATANSAKRKKWFPKGEFELSSQTKDKYFRGSWNDSARIEIGFYAKGDDKAQIAIQVNRLARKSEVESQRELWKAAVAKLDTMLSG